MNVFDTLLVQPIFNVLVFIYGVVPGHDFGVALILFTILIRVAMWPLVRRQLHQTKVMQHLQPELKKIKQRTKGNKQLEAQLMTELYRERGVNPFGSIGLLLVQLPIFIALFAVVRLITDNHANITKYTYSGLSHIPYIKDLVAHTNNFNEHLFGVVDLTKQATSAKGVYIPLLIMAIAAAGLQFWQSKQLLPKVEEGRRLRDVLKEQATGKSMDQSEMSALMSSRMIYFFPALTFFISIYLSGALVLYLLVTSAVAIFQQSVVLGQDTKELTAIGEKQSSSKVKNAQEAKIVETPPRSKNKRRKK